MYVCNCNALNDRQIRAAIEAGAKRWTDVHAYHGVAPQCGSCGSEIASIINPTKSEENFEPFDPAETKA